MSVERLEEIESGKSLPTFEEFFALCIVLDIAENLNLRELYPTLYEEYYSEIARGAYRSGIPFRRNKDGCNEN